jgi:hypothetical protein
MCVLTEVSMPLNLCATLWSVHYTHNLAANLHIYNNLGTSKRISVKFDTDCLFVKNTVWTSLKFQ